MLKHIRYITKNEGRIQGDGRKFLERFKLFWVTNIITIIK